MLKARLSRKKQHQGPKRAKFWMDWSLSSVRGDLHNHYHWKEGEMVHPIEQTTLSHSKLFSQIKRCNLSHCCQYFQHCSILFHHFYLLFQPFLVHLVHLECTFETLDILWIIIMIDLDEYCDTIFRFRQCWDWFRMFVDTWIFTCLISQHEVFFMDKHALQMYSMCFKVFGFCAPRIKTS